MKKLKRFAAVLFTAAMVVAALGSENVEAAGKSDLVVVLDAGHGGSDTGAVGNRLYEKVLTLKIAQYCKVELEKYQGVKVYMTRENDRYLSLEQRVADASAAKADVFVSIHINSAAVASANGAEVYYPNSNYRPNIKFYDWHFLSGRIGCRLLRCYPWSEKSGISRHYRRTCLYFKCFRC